MIMDWEDVSAGNVMGSTVEVTELVVMFGEKTVGKTVGNPTGGKSNRVLGNNGIVLLTMCFGYW